MDFLEDILNKGVTQFHVVQECANYLGQHGFTRLEMGEKWQLSFDRSYFVCPYRSELIAFTTGEDIRNLRLATAHTDFPMLKLKPNPEMKKNGYVLANVEPYGGLLISTWFDRPLGLAGKVVLKGKEPFSPEVRLYDSEEPLFIIPNLAPHMKKGEDDRKTDVQKELLPLFSSDASILEVVAAKLMVAVTDILDYDLYLYNMDKCQMIGTEKKLISSPRIDNVSSVAALTEVLADGAGKQGKKNLNIAALFDNEEIGSRSKQGADSMMLKNIIDRIVDSLGLVHIEQMMENAFTVSLDVAHALHPNYPEKSDPVNVALLGNGVVLKFSASQRYVSDSEASAVVEALADKYGFRLQKTVNRSGMPGGSTLGPVIASYLPVKAVDMGIPVLAMHSARELGCISDYQDMKKLIAAVYE